MSVKKPQQRTAGQMFYAVRGIVYAEICGDLSAILLVPLQLLMARKLYFQMLISSGRFDAMNADKADVQRHLFWQLK